MSSSSPLSAGPQSLGDLVGTAIDLAKHAFLRCLGVSAVLTIPSAVLTTIGLRLLYGFMATFGGDEVPDGTQMLTFMGGGFVLFVVAGLLSLWSLSASVMAGSWIVGRTSEGQPAPIGEALGRAFGRDTFSGMIQMIVLLSGVILGFVILGIVAAIGGAVIGREAGAGLGVALFLLTLILLVPAALVATFYSQLGLIVTAWEQLGPFAAIGRAARLMRGRWWSTFGVWLVFIVIAYFIQLVVTMPFFIATMLPFYVKLFASALQHASAPDPQEIAQMMTSMVWAIGVVSFVSGAVISAILPITLGVQYSDLRAFEEGTTEE